MNSGREASYSLHFSSWQGRKVRKRYREREAPAECLGQCGCSCPLPYQNGQIGDRPDLLCEQCLAQGNYAILSKAITLCVILTFWKGSPSMLQICRELLPTSSKHDDQDTLFEGGVMADAADASLLSYRKGFFYYFW